MLLLNPDESLGRIQARRTLGLAIESKCVYVQLGAGNINDIDHDLGEVVHELLQRSGADRHRGIDARSEDTGDHERVRVLRDYPNSRFLQAFDAAVQAGGYNSFHEMRVAGIPTLFLPNAQTGMDDQERRCMTSIDEGWGVVRKRNDSRTMRQLIDEMFDLNRPSVRDIKNGSDVLAIELLRVIEVVRDSFALPNGMELPPFRDAGNDYAGIIDGHDSLDVNGVEVSIVIPHFNRIEMLRRTLAMLTH